MHEIFRKSSFNISHYDPKATGQLAHDAGLFARAMRMKSKREEQFVKALTLFPELTDDSDDAFDFRRTEIAVEDIAYFDPVDVAIPEEIYHLLAEVQKEKMFSRIYVMTSERGNDANTEYLLAGIVKDGAKNPHVFRLARWGDPDMPSWFELEERLRDSRRIVASEPFLYVAEPFLPPVAGRIFKFALFLVLLAIMYFVVVPFVSGTLNNMCDAGPCVPRYGMPLPPYQLP